MRFSMPLPVAVALLGAGAAAATELPVRSVTLSNAGLMEIERAGSLPPEAAITFRAPIEDVDDVLKSLLVRDPAGTVEGVRLPAQDLAAEAFRGLPVRPDDFATRVSLLRALRGYQVTAGGVTGRLTDAEETDAGMRVSLLTGGGLRLLILREGDEVGLVDPALAARMQRAAEALAAARTEDERQVEIRLRGATAAREVAFTYVAAAPLWKPSWRLLVPASGTPAAGAPPAEARLQGWAVVENRSGADWDGIRLSLVSGNPAAFHQPLFTPIRVQRAELPVRVAEQVRVQADTGGRPPPPPPPPMPVMAAPAPPMAGADAPGRGRGLLAGAATRAEMAPEEPRRFAEQVAATPAAIAASTAGRVAFTLPAPVAIRTGETANVPFLDTSVPAERIWWVQDLSARNPLQAVRLTNNTGHTLPDGLATVFGSEGAEAGAYLGDAEIRAVAPAESRILAFARDRDVQMTSASSTNERPVKITLRRGVVVVGAIRQEEQALAIDPHGGRGRLVVDVPRRPNIRPLFTVASEGDFGLRHEAMLEGTPTTLRFAFERETELQMPIFDQGLGDPLLWRWRDLNVEQNLRRLPGGPGTLESLTNVLERLPRDAPGRSGLAAVVQSLNETRKLLDVARTAIRQTAVAEQTLERARSAVEDRTGPQREEARRRLNAASLEVDRTGAAADAAWEAWVRAVQELLSRTG